MIQLQIHQRELNVPRQLQAKVSNSLTRSALQPAVFKELRELTIKRGQLEMTIDPTTLHWMIVKYSEQAVFSPLREIQHWFAYSSRAHLDPGYSPLFYFGNRSNTPSPNKTAIAAVGEGVAGFLAQRLHHCRKLARPNHDYPDIVMSTVEHTVLVEAKATINGSRDKIVSDNLLDFVSSEVT